MKGLTKGLKIETNHFTNVPDVAIAFSKTDGASITGNVITTDATTTHALISVMASTNATVSNNQITGNGITIGNGVTATPKDTYTNEEVPVTGLVVSGNIIKNLNIAFVNESVVGEVNYNGNTVDNTVKATIMTKGTDNGTIKFDKNNKLTSEYLLYINKGSMAKDAKILISKEAEATGIEKNLDDISVERFEEPVNPVDPTNPDQTDPEDKPVTKPKDENKTTDVATPNTGANNVIATVLVATSITAIALGGAVVAKRAAKANR